MTHLAPPAAATAPAIQTRQHLEAVLENIAQLQRARDELRQTQDDEITAIRLKYRAALAEMNDYLDLETSWVESWALAHQDSFSPDRRLVCAQATLGFRATPPRVERASRRWTWSRIAAALGDRLGAALPARPPARSRSGCAHSGSVPPHTGPVARGWFACRAGRTFFHHPSLPSVGIQLAGSRLILFIFPFAGKHNRISRAGSFPFSQPPTSNPMNYSLPDKFSLESLRLEAVTVCVGFDDLLDLTLPLNHPHLDTMIVVTSHADRRTQQVAKKHGAICVQTDLFSKNGRHFNKGAAINAGLGRFQYHGWRLHLDADIILPDNFRRMLFNHTQLDMNSIYGADRIDIIGLDQLQQLRDQWQKSPQAAWSFLLNPVHQHAIGSRYVDTLRGYVPIGFFQLWHASAQKDYPWSLGTAQHDDILFAEQWPRTHRVHLPTVITYHLCAEPPKLGENWDGHRSQPRLA